MAYRKASNRHQEWVRWRERHVDELANAQIPVAAFDSEHSLVQFLTAGCLADGSANLESIPDAQFLELEQAVNELFRDGWTQVTFTALQAVRLRRFGRYA